MIADPRTSVAFSGHRTYCGDAADALRRTVGELYARGFRTFLSGMAVGFDLAAAEAVLELRDRMPGIRLVAAVPFRGQEVRFPQSDRECYGRVLAAADAVEVLSPVYHRGCYAVRNDFLVDNARVLVAWYDGSPGGTHYTVRRALRRGLEVLDLHPAAPALSAPAPTLFG
ncbi:SLOG family protein [Alistipes provencensis]|uniref:SLOG family protein n=1 Tax=Alistipes provencensis TaxID=1816676 RepID=UPI0007ED887B|nr:SLOG family protein [Alistipes provencensis]